VSWIIDKSFSGLANSNIISLNITYSPMQQIEVDQRVDSLSKTSNCLNQPVTPGHLRQNSVQIQKRVVWNFW
jgi:hypothetical protein